MFNAYAALLLNAPADKPLCQKLLPHFITFCSPSSVEYWPEFADALREQHPDWFTDQVGSQPA